jgi:uncharacterized protein YqeY
LIGDCSKVVKEPSDAECIAMIKKFIKNAETTLELLQGKGIKNPKLEDEIEILQEYLPSQLSESHIKTLIANIVAGTHSEELTLKDVMAFFKKNYEGQYDGGTVSKIAKEVFK